MDEELTAGYSEPCPRCSSLLWGVSEEGHFFCKSCHNVIERTREVVDASAPGTARVSTVKRGPRVKRAEGGRQWVVCEGFQFILKSQAEALVKLGVDPKFQDEVLVRIWRLYLQKTHQAFTHRPVQSSTFRLSRPGSDSESGPSSGSGLSSRSGLSSGSGWVSESGPDYSSGLDSGSRPGSQIYSGDSDTQPSVTGSQGSTGELSDWSVGSLDSDAFVSVGGRRRSGPNLMSMKKTLALLYVALVWSRQHVTLTHLLRLVDQGVVPYLNSYECFPEEMKLNNKDGLIFRVQSVPSYSVIHSESKHLVRFLGLPAFPPISIKSPLHPLNLSLRLMTELNLPDEMSKWVELVLTEADLLNPEHLTFDPRGRLPHYELLAAASIIVTLKTLSGLDDRTEWILSSEASSAPSGTVFSVRRWYRVLHKALSRARRRRDRIKARKQWVPQKPFYFSQKEKIVALKRRRVSEQLTSCFKRLSSTQNRDAQSDEGGGAYGFHFLWGQSPQADGRSMYHMTLKGGARTEVTNLLSDQNYWHPPTISSSRCREHWSLLRPSLPQMFLWTLDLFSFVLRVEPHVVFEAVLSLERRLFKIQKSRPPRPPQRRRRRKRSRKRSRTVRSRSVRSRERSRSRSEPRDERSTSEPRSKRRRSRD